MASYYRSEYYCSVCKIINKRKKCPHCGNTKTDGRGTWGVRFRTVENNVNINKNISGLSTKAEAEQKMYKYIEQNKNLTEKDIVIFPTINDVFYTILERKKQTTKESSWSEYELRYIDRIKPMFGDKIINELNLEELKNWQTELDKYSYNYKTKIKSILNNILNYSKEKYNTQNLLLELPKFKKIAVKQEMSIWTEIEFVQFINSVEDLMYKCMFSTLYLCGLRKGELIALKIKDLDLANQTLKIDKTFSRVSYKNKLGKTCSKYLLGTPKSINGYRTILLPENLTKLLKEYMDYKILNKKHSENDYLFGGDDFVKYTTLDNHFKKYIKLSGVKKIRMHDLRHSHVSLVINKHIVSDKYANAMHLVMIIAKRIGDAPEQIFKVYGHLFPNQQESIMDSINIVI